MAEFAGKAQQEYLQQRTLHLQAAAAQGSVSRPQRSLLQRHREDIQSLAAHACLLALALLGSVPPLCQVPHNVTDAPWVLAAHARPHLV